MELSKAGKLLSGILVVLCSLISHAEGHGIVPATPVLISPADGAGKLPLSVDLSWGSVDKASSYEVQVATASTFGATVFDQAGEILPGARLEGLSGGTTYFWRANASFGRRTSAWSGAASFTTVGTIDSKKFLPGDQVHIQCGDALKIVAFPDSGALLSGTYFIDNNGYADFPLIGMTDVIHSTPAEIEQYLTNKYKVFLPRQNIIVRLMYRTALLGGFLKPGVYWVDSRGSLWDVIQQGGGTVREDGIKKVEWVHDEGGTIEIRKIRPYLQSDQSLASIGFKSGDQLTVSAMPKQGAWELFKDGILPVLSLTASLLVSYEVFQFYKNNH